MSPASSGRAQLGSECQRCGSAKWRNAPQPVSGVIQACQVTPLGPQMHAGVSSRKNGGLTELKTVLGLTGLVWEPQVLCTCM